MLSAQAASGVLIEGAAPGAPWSQHCFCSAEFPAARENKTCMWPNGSKAETKLFWREQVGVHLCFLCILGAWTKTKQVQTMKIQMLVVPCWGRAPDPTLVLMTCGGSWPAPHTPGQFSSLRFPAGFCSWAAHLRYNSYVTEHSTQTKAVYIYARIKWKEKQKRNRATWEFKALNSTQCSLIL